MSWRICSVGAAFCVAAALVAPARAADLPMPVKAPPVATGSNWSGFYVGGHAGYAFGNNDFGFIPEFAELSGLSRTDIFGSRGYSAGMLAGYNVTLGSRWLAGVEADWSWQDIRNSFTLTEFGESATLAFKQSWAASVRGRLGYFVTPQTLLFGTVGWSWSRVDMSYNEPGFGSVGGSAGINGLQLGIGMETAIAQNWRARIEYLQTLYRDGDFGPAISQEFGISGIAPRVGVGRIAAIYDFGDGSARPAQAPRPAAITPSWTGFYAGGSIGAGMAYGDVTFNGVEGVPGQAEIKGAGLTVPVPAVFVGFNYQFVPRWVVGAEAEIAPSVRSTDLTLGWIGALRGRVGFLLMPDTLIYATAGYGKTHIDDLMYRGIVAVEGQDIHGIQVGGGIEAAFAPHWSARFDYQYAIVDRVDVRIPGIDSNLLSGTLDARGHMGRIGLVYNFGG